MTEEEKIEGRKYAAWLNLFIGLYNMYLWGIEGNIFNITVGNKYSFLIFIYRL